jgi:hypothetical protein
MNYVNVVETNEGGRGGLLNNEERPDFNNYNTVIRVKEIKTLARMGEAQSLRSFVLESDSPEDHDVERRLYRYCTLRQQVLVI